MTSTNCFRLVVLLSVELAQIVDKTLQPKRVEVWLRRR